MLDEAVALHKGEIGRSVTAEDIEEWGIDPTRTPGNHKFLTLPGSRTTRRRAAAVHWKELAKVLIHMNTSRSIVPAAI